MSLILFGTSGCHLCEEAEAIMATYFQQVKFDKIDIADQQQWQEKYAIKIPVLYDSETGKDLCWPFSEANVDEFLKVQ